MDLSLATRVEGKRTVVSVVGEVDLHTAPTLEEAFDALARAGRYHLVVDLEQVGFLDCPGLSVLIGALQRLRRHDGSLRLVCTRESTLRVFRITGLTDVLPFYDSVAAALAAGVPAQRVHGQVASAI